MLFPSSANESVGPFRVSTNIKGEVVMGHTLPARTGTPYSNVCLLGSVEPASIRLSHTARKRMLQWPSLPHTFTLVTFRRKIRGKKPLADARGSESALCVYSTLWSGGDDILRRKVANPRQ